MNDEQKAREIKARRIFFYAMQGVLNANEELFPGGMGSKNLYTLLGNAGGHLDANLKAGHGDHGHEEFDPKAAVMHAAYMAAIVFAIVRNQGLVNEIDFPKIAEELKIE